jgi:hypothetical protein
MPKRPIESLRARYRGRPAVVLGSAPSLAEELGRAPAGAVTISVNLRPLALCPRPDFLVFLDEAVGLASAAAGVPRVSTLPRWSDFDLCPEAWDGGFSPSLAVWLGCYLGCAPVLLAGFDCYRSDPAYCDGTDDPRQRAYPLHFHFRAWAPAIERCPDSRAIRVLGGPLTALFGAWPEET